MQPAVHNWLHVQAAGVLSGFCVSLSLSDPAGSGRRSTIHAVSLMTPDVVCHHAPDCSPASQSRLSLTLSKMFSFLFLL